MSKKRLYEIIQNLYPVKLKNIPLGLSKKMIFMPDIVAKFWGFCDPVA